MRYTINFSERQLEAINTLLSDAPYKSSAPLIAHINSEVTRLYNEQYDKQRETKDEPVTHHPV